MNIWEVLLTFAAIVIGIFLALVIGDRIERGARRIEEGEDGFFTRILDLLTRK